MHHLTLHHGPNSRLVASDLLTDFTSLTTVGSSEDIALVQIMNRQNAMNFVEGS